MHPKDWQLTTLEECTDLLTGFAFSSEDYIEPSTLSVRLLRGDNVVAGGIRWDDAKHFPDGNKQTLKRYELKQGDVVIALDRPIVGSGLKCTTVKEHDLPCLLVQRVARLRGKETIEQSYLAQTIQTHRFVEHLRNNKTETAVPHVSPNDIRKYQVALPKICEQRKIARILETWDTAISTTTRLLANSRKQKQTLMRRLLSGKRRFGQPQGTWQHLAFDELFERVTRKNKIGNTNVLTISGQDGLISQRDYFNKSVASENLAGYTLLERYDFAYNKSYSAGYPMGAVKPLLTYNSGVVSSLYICFRLKDGVDANFHFFRHYFEAGLLNEEISGIAQEGARNHGLLNVGISDFFKLRLHVPPLPVQLKVAEAINVAEAEEHLFKEQLERYQFEKQALMQQLLTGKRRVKLDEPAEEASTT